MSAFEELGISPELIRACEELGWLLPTPIQAEAVPLILGGGDVEAVSRDGYRDHPRVVSGALGLWPGHLRLQLTAPPPQSMDFCRLRRRAAAKRA